MNVQTELKTTPEISGATNLACAIANRIANLDGLSHHIDETFLAAIARAVTSEIDAALPAMLSQPVIVGKDGQLFIVLPESLSMAHKDCRCESCKSGKSRRQSALTCSPKGEFSWLVHYSREQQVYSLAHGYKMAGRGPR
jgi:hypothetical protein